jgi:hypothetical protein
MNKFDKLLKKERFYKHYIDDCVLRTVPINNWITVYVKFSKESEYKIRPDSKLFADSIFMNKPEWIAKEEYYNF